MLVTLVYNSRLARFLGAGATTLYPFIFFAMSREEADRDRVIDHEFVHVRQVRRLGWLRFYASYLWEYLRAVVKLRKHWEAYYTISYEKEAFAAGELDFTNAELVEISLAHGEMFRPRLPRK